MTIVFRRHARSIMLVLGSLLLILVNQVAESFRPSSFTYRTTTKIQGGCERGGIQLFKANASSQGAPRWRLRQVSLRKHDLPSALFMYNLPPSDDEGGLGPLVSGILTFLGILLFFASPLGALFFAVFNSLIVLSIAIPFAAVLGFQVWQYFNTIAGPCPNCGSPLRVMKQVGNESSPSICLNCGSFVQASDDNCRIELLGRPTSTSLDEEMIRDFWSGWLDPSAGVRRVESTDATRKRRQKELTIIDIEASSEDDDDSKLKS